MQRFFTMATLFIFMVMLSWVAYSVQPESLLPLPWNNPDSMNSEPHTEQEDPPPERMALPHRNGEELTETEMLEMITREDRAEPETAPEQPGMRAESIPANYDADSIHFLLLGSRGGAEGAGLIIIITLVTGKEAHLTLIDPSIPSGAADGSEPIGALLNNGRGGYGLICEATESISGITPQFYIDINLDGFSEMIELLGGIEHAGGSDAVVLAGLERYSGPDILKVLGNPDITIIDKEALIISMLITARDVDNTSLGLALLWTGYKNIKTNLSLNDLLQLRRVTQQISPTTVTLHEIKP